MGGSLVAIGSGTGNIHYPLQNSGTFLCFVWWWLFFLSFLELSRNWFARKPTKYRFCTSFFWSDDMEKWKLLLSIVFQEKWTGKLDLHFSKKPQIPSTLLPRNLQQASNHCSDIPLSFFYCLQWLLLLPLWEPSADISASISTPYKIEKRVIELNLCTPLVIFPCIIVFSILPICPKCNVYITL